MRRSLKAFSKRIIASTIALIILLTMIPFSFAEGSVDISQVTRTISGNESITTDTVIQANDVWQIESGATLTVSGAALIVKGALVVAQGGSLVTAAQHDNETNTDVDGAVTLQEGGCYIEGDRYLYGYTETVTAGGRQLTATLVLPSAAQATIKKTAEKSTLALSATLDELATEPAVIRIISPFELSPNDVLVCGDSVKLVVETGWYLGAFTAQPGAEIYNDSMENAAVCNLVINADVYHKVSVFDAQNALIKEDYAKTGHDVEGNIVEGSYTVEAPQGQFIESLSIDGEPIDGVAGAETYTFTAITPRTVTVAFAEKAIPVLVQTDFPEYVEKGQAFDAKIETTLTAEDITINDTVYPYSDEYCQKDTEKETILWTISFTAPADADAVAYVIKIGDASTEVTVNTVDPISLSLSAESNGVAYTNNTWTKNDVTFTATAVGGVPETKVVYRKDSEEERDMPEGGTLTVEESASYSFYAVDGTGKKTDEQTYVVNIDKTDPTINVTLFSDAAMLEPDDNGWYSQVTVTVEAADTGSGIKTVYYQHGESTIGLNLSDDGKASFTVDTDTTADNFPNYTFTVEDNAGNRKEVTKAVRIDKTSPKASIQVTRTDALGSFIMVVTGRLIRVNSESYSVTVTAEDTESGVESIKCYIFEESEAPAEGEPINESNLVVEAYKNDDGFNGSATFDFSNLSSGNYVVYVIVADSLGNELKQTFQYQTEEQADSDLVFHVDNSDNVWDAKVDDQSFTASADAIEPIYVKDSFTFTAKASNDTKVYGLQVSFNNTICKNGENPIVLGARQYDSERGFVVDGNVLLSQFGIGTTENPCPDGTYGFILTSTSGESFTYTVIKDSDKADFDLVLSDPDTYTLTKDLTVTIKQMPASGIASVTIKKETDEGTAGNETTLELIDGEYQSSITENGKYIVTATSKTGVSSTETITVDKIYKDAPVLTLTPVGVNGNDGWAKQGDPCAIQLSVNEENLGEVTYQIKDQNGDFQNVTLDADSQYAVLQDVDQDYTFRAVGENGKVSEEKTIRMKRDTVAPSVASYDFSSDGIILGILKKIFTNKKQTYLTVSNIADNLSGISKVYLATYENGSYQTIDATDPKNDVNYNGIQSKDEIKFTITGNINAPIVIVVEDVAGNVLYQSTDTSIVLDESEPAIIFSSDVSPVYTDQSQTTWVNYFDRAVTVTVTITDANLELDNNDTKVTFNGEVMTLAKNPADSNTYVASVFVSNNSTNEILVSAVDRAGNGRTDSYQFVVDTKPADVSIQYRDAETISANGKTYIQNDSATAVVTVEEDNFNAEKSTITVSKDGGEFVAVENLQWTPLAGEPGKYQAIVPLGGENGEAAYTIKVAAKSFAQENETEETFIVVLDQTPPTYEITYGENPVTAFLNNTTLNLFFKETIEVKVTVSDNVAGVQSASVTADETVSKENITPVENQTELLISIEPQYKGTILVEASDYATNKAAATTAVDLTGNLSDLPGDFTDVQLIVDDIDPEISDITGIDQDAYTDQNVTLSFSITEANFFEEDVNLVVTRDGKELAKDQYQYRCLTNESAPDQHDFTLIFTDEGKYTVTVNLSDKSTNSAQEKTKTFTIDKTAPVATISFDKVAVYTGDSIKYFSGDSFPVKATVKVIDNNFDAANSKVSVTDPTREDINTLYEVSAWEKGVDDNEHIAIVTLKNEANFNIVANVKDLVGKDGQAEDFATLDQTAPTYDIIYSDDPIKAFINDATLGLFFSKTVDVTVKVKDAVAGVKSVAIASTLSDGVSSVNQAPGAILETLVEKTTDCSKTFSIAPQFRGTITVTATDYAENKTADTTAKDLTNNVKNLPDGFDAAEDAVEIVVDDQKPIISDIKLTSNEEIAEPEVGTKNYAKAAVQASFTVQEANFFKDDVKVEIISEDNDGVKTTTVYHDGKVKVNGEVIETNPYSYTVKPDDKEDTYLFTLLFNDEADYSVTVKYEDKSRNEAAKSTTFTIDTTSPQIKVDYEPKQPQETGDGQHGGISYYSDKVTATVKVTDHNFDDKTSAITVRAADIDGELLANDDEKLFKISEWKKSTDTDAKDTYEATVSLPGDANYTLNVIAKDYSKNESSYENNITVDTTAPAVKVEYSVDPVRSVLNNLTILGFKDTVEVKVTVTDNISGVKKLTFSGDLQSLEFVGTEFDGTLSSGAAGSEFQAIKEQVAESTEKERTLEKTFTISPQYRGSLTIKAWDQANNLYNVTYADITRELDQSNNKTSMIIVDNKAPVIMVTYDQAPAYRGNRADYYKNSVTATVTVRDHNFNPKKTDINIFNSSGTGDLKGNCSISGWKKGSTDATGVTTYTKTVRFNTDANYTLEVTSEDFSGNRAAAYRHNVTVDKTDPIIEVSNIEFSKVADDTDENLIEKYADYKHFFNGTARVKITANDSTSGVKCIRVYTMDYSTDPRGVREEKQTVYANTEKLTDLVYEFDLNPNFKGYVYAQAEDYATNITMGNTPEGYIQSEGVILENLAKHESIALSQEASIIPGRAPNENGFYNADLPVKLVISDDFSGIQSLQYTIGSAEPVSIDLKADSGVISIPYQWSQDVILSAASNDNNNVPVILSYIDNAGNPHQTATTFKVEYKVDVTAPVIDVSYDNNTSYNATYFDNARTLTIKITELNFRASDVVFTIMRDGEPFDVLTPTDEAWKTNGIEHTATIAFAYDGDYTFDVSYTDLSGNPNNGVNYADSVAPQAFTIDMIDPSIDVKYDNEKSINGDYYDSGRTATVTITEHNFDASKAVVTVTAKNRRNGSASTLPAVSQWQQVGTDKYAATVVFNNDGYYTLTVSAQDLAFRKAFDYALDDFTVDKTAPVVSVTKVAHLSASNAKVIAPLVRITDDNVNGSGVNISLVGAKNGSVFYMENGMIKKQGDGYGDTHETDTLFTYQFDNILEDDIYTLTVITRDMAGNQNKSVEVIDGSKKTVQLTDRAMKFSVNRKGSTYELNDATKKVVADHYVNKAPTLVVTEINVNEISNYKVSVGSAGNVKYIQDGTDFNVAKHSPNEKNSRGGTATWHENTYTISEKNFSTDQEYVIALVSEDEATNKNATMKAGCEITFCLDTQKPIGMITAEGAEKNIINAEKATVRIDVTDSNSDIEKCSIVLDDKLLQIVKEGDEYVLKDGDRVVGRYDPEKNCFFLTVENAGTSWEESHHTIEFVAVDMANNESSKELYKFTMSTNFLYRFLSNKPLFFGSIGGLALILAGIVVLIVLKKKKKNDESEPVQ